MKAKKNLFATVLTYPAPSSNYRGESEENRTVLQKISRAGREHTVISPESMRNALREMLQVAGFPCNRQRLKNWIDPNTKKTQLAVEFKEIPNAKKYADDYLFGFMVVDKDIRKKFKGPLKRDSVLRMNMAVALTPFRFDSTFHQSPLNAGKSPWKNSSTSALLHREVAYTAYQYPFALAHEDCVEKPDWVKALIESIGELTGVAGGHARSLFEMSPRSIIVRLTARPVVGMNSYGFDENGDIPELSRINKDDLSGNEFWLGGEIVRNMADAHRNHLSKEGVQLFDNPQKCLSAVSESFLPSKGKKKK